MKNIIKNRLFISGVCLLLAAVIAFGIMPKFYENRNAVKTVLRACTDISAGTQLTAANCEEVLVGAYNHPQNIITDKELLIGKYASADIPNGAYFFENQVSDYRADKQIDSIMNSNMRLVTVSVSTAAAGLSSHLKAGDTVSVATYTPPVERASLNGYSYTPASVNIAPELKGLTVYAVENSQTYAVDEIRENTENSSGTDDTVTATVTLAVTEEQAKKLILAEYSGKLHIIFEKRGVPNVWEK